VTGTLIRKTHPATEPISVEAEGLMPMIDRLFVPFKAEFRVKSGCGL